MGVAGRDKGGGDEGGYMPSPARAHTYTGVETGAFKRLQNTGERREAGPGRSGPGAGKKGRVKMRKKARGVEEGEGEVIPSGRGRREEAA